MIRHYRYSLQAIPSQHQSLDDASHPPIPYEARLSQRTVYISDPKRYTHTPTTRFQHAPAFQYDKQVKSYTAVPKAFSTLSLLNIRTLDGFIRESVLEQCTLASKQHIHAASYTLPATRLRL